MCKDNSYISNIKNNGLSYFSGDWLYIQDNYSINYLKKLLKGKNYCSDMFINGHCPHCETFYQKQIFCNKEYCINRMCQEKSHLRRWARALPKYAQFKKFGYFVFTFPMEICEHIGKKFLKKFRDFIYYLIEKYLGKIKTIFRYHYFGDAFYRCESFGECEFKATAKNKTFPICNNFYYQCSFKKRIKNKFAPHLNALIDYNWIDNDILEFIKNDIIKWIKNNTGVSIDNINLHYQFAKDLPQAMHWIKYIFRSTMRVLKDNERYIARVYKFRNTTYKGNYIRDKSKYLDIIKARFGDAETEKIKGDTIKIINNICIICKNDKIDWVSGIKRFLLCNTKEIGESGFYYQLIE